MQQLSEENITTLRAAFSTSAGKSALLWIINECGTFNPIPVDETAVALKNFSLALLTALGGGGILESSVKSFVDNLSRQPIEKVKADE
jgi:hypothetical protein